MRLDVFIHWVDGDPPPWATRMQASLDSILTLEKTLMTDLTALETKVSANGTVIGSAVTLLQGLKSALDSAGTDPVKLAALSDSLGANTQTLADAIVANTPAAPPA